MRGQIPELEKVPQVGRARMQHPFFQVFAVMLEILPAVCPGTVRVIIFQTILLESKRTFGVRLFEDILISNQGDYRLAAETP